MRYKNILIAPDKFKGSLGASDVCRIISDEISRVYPDVNAVSCPLADGGEGSLECFCRSTGATLIEGEYTNSDFDKIRAAYAVFEGTAFIETAQTAGLVNCSEKNPLFTTTYGVGEQIANALSRGVKRIYLAMGGSSTNDAGCGMAAALGWTFLDGNGKSFVPTGGTLCKIASITAPEKPLDADFVALCDVNNVLYGHNGAAYVYAAQKGANNDGIKLLDNGLRHINGLFMQNGKDYSDSRGAGAAGGLGAGVQYFIGAELQSGIRAFFELCDIRSKISAADLIISGEGKIDAQSDCGKAVMELAKICAGKRFVAFCGVNENEAADFEIYAINRDGETLPQSIANTEVNLRRAASEFFSAL